MIAVLRASVVALFLVGHAFGLTPMATQIQYSQTQNRIQFSVIHPQTGATVQGSRDAGSATVSGVINANGVLAWVETRSLGAGRFEYDVSMAMWRPVGGWTVYTQRSASGGFGQSVSELQNRDGVVAWVENISLSGGYYDHYVRYAICDPASGWRTDYETTRYDGAFALNLTTRDGVVSWRDSYQISTLADVDIYYTIYNPVGRTWATSSWHATSVSPLSVGAPGISNATVRWTSGSQVVTRGYANRSWQSSPTTPMAYFFPSVTTGAPPLTVWFTDMSIASASITWTFGDGTPASGQRSVFHGFSGLGRFTVTQSTTGSSASTNILTDTAPPLGTIAIGQGMAFTNTSTITLSMAAIDNSGSVSAMRLSNDGTVWAAWESFTTTKIWTLAAGSGTRTVWVQFRDPAGNASASVSDSIVIDLVPPSGSISVNSGLDYTREALATLTLTAADPGGAAVMMRLGTDGTHWGPWEPYATNRTWMLDGGVRTNKVYAQFLDAAGNVSAVLNDSIIYDPGVPLGLSNLRLRGSNQMEVTVSAFPGERFAIRGTSGVRSWDFLGQFTNATGRLVFSDPSAAGSAWRFYKPEPVAP